MSMSVDLGNSHLEYLVAFNEAGICCSYIWATRPLLHRCCVVMRDEAYAACSNPRWSQGLYPRLTFVACFGIFPFRLAGPIKAYVSIHSGRFHDSVYDARVG